MCPDRELISAWIDGEVPSPWGETIERHLAGCASCSEAAAAMRAGRAAFGADLDALDGDAERAKVRVEERLMFSSPVSEARSRPFWAKRYAVPFPVAAAAALALAVLGLSLAQSGRRNTELRMAVWRAFEATPLATSGLGIESVIDFVSKQSGAVNINISLPAEAFGGVLGEPVLIREADYLPRSRR